MAQLLVRHLDDDVKAKLELRARRHGHTLEEEVREILRNAVRDEKTLEEPLGTDREPLRRQGSLAGHPRDSEASWGERLRILRRP